MEGNRGMNQELRNKWDHSNDPEYGQRLLGWIFRRHSWHLLAALLFGALVFGIASLFMPPRFGTSASIMVNKGGGGASLLSGLSLLGGPPAALADEILTLQSREIGLQVIEELGLQIEIFDPQGPDAPVERLKGRLGSGSNRNQTREDIYTRLSISDVLVNDDMAKTQEMWISADAEGNWKLGGESGANGQPVSGKHISFTPHFGGSHKAGNRYLLKVRPDHEAWRSYKESLTVGPAAVDASVLSIRFNSYNPLLARMAVDLIVEKYLELNRSRTFDEYDQMLAYIADETKTAEERTIELVAQIQDIQDETGLFAPAAQGEMVVLRMSELATQRTQNRIAIRQIDNVLGTMDKLSPRELSEIIQAPATPLELENSLVLRLSSLVTSLENHLSNKTEKHPDVVNLRNQIDVTTKMIRDSLRSNREGLFLVDRELGGDYGRLSGELAEMPAANSDMNMLNAELKSLRDIMEILKKQETETKLSKVNTSMDVTLMDAAPFPAKREKPAIGRNTALGGFAGLMLCILVLLFRESAGKRFRTLKELRAGAGLHVLAVLPGKPPARRWSMPQIEPELAADVCSRILSSGSSIGLIHLPAGRPAFDAAAYLASQANMKICDALPGAGLAGFNVQLLDGSGTEITCERVSADLNATPGQRYAGFRKPAGPSLYLLAAPSRWSAEAELAASLDRLVLCVPQGGCTGEELERSLQMLAAHGLDCHDVIVSNWSAARDIYGTEELNFVATSSGKVR
jgi:uncharacterized protein involved in exopolysaccharide biosynthesis